MPVKKLFVYILIISIPYIIYFSFDAFLCLKKFCPASEASSLLTPGIICSPFTGFISRNTQGLWSGAIPKKTLSTSLISAPSFPFLAWLMFLKHSRFVALTKLPSCLLQVSHIFQDLLIKSFYQTCFQTLWEWSRTSEGFYHFSYPTLNHRAKEYTPTVHSCFYFWHLSSLFLLSTWIVKVFRKTLHLIPCL